MEPTPSEFANRLRFVDASRAGAMFFVLLAHFGVLYFGSEDAGMWRKLFVRAGMIASPTFIIISGVLLGVLFYNSGSRFAQVRYKLLDRGLFLLFAGHALICIALLPHEHTARWSLSTDAIGAAIILGPLLIPHLDSTMRLVVSAAAYVLSWVVVWSWLPSTHGGAVIKELVFGQIHPTVFHAGSFPIVPWVSFYLASSVLGERLARRYSKRDHVGAARELAAVSAVALGAAATMKLMELTVLRRFVVADASDATFVSALLWFGQKYPPGPMYVLFYAGCGLTMLTCFLLIEINGWFSRAREYAAVCGETSLFIFIAHFYVYWLGLPMLPRRPVILWPLYFIPSVVLIAEMARWWHRRGYNRLLTVGARRHHHPHQTWAGTEGRGVEWRRRFVVKFRT